MSHILYVFLCLVIFAGGVAGQKKVTNADVVAMVKGGLPESTIILSIQKGPTEFDTSALALLELKKQGVNQRIMDAMILSGSNVSSPKSPNETPRPSTSPMTPDSFSELNKVAISDGKQLTQLKLLNVSGTKGSLSPLIFVPIGGLFAKSKSTVRYAGSRADIRTNIRQPDFVFSVLSEQSLTGYVSVLKLKVKGSERSVEAGRVSVAGGATTGFNKKDLVEVSVEETGSSANGKLKTYRARPITNLPAGEYAFVLGNMLLDFGVDQ